MTSPFGLILSSVFMCHFENISLENCRAHFKPILKAGSLMRHFYSFKQRCKNVEKFKNYLNKQHKNITFTSEIEEYGLLSFMDITITAENNKLVTSVYRKPTFGGVFTNSTHKRGLI